MYASSFLKKKYNIKKAGGQVIVTGVIVIAVDNTAVNDNAAVKRDNTAVNRNF